MISNAPIIITNEDTTVLRHSDLSRTGEKPKLKLNYTCLKKRDGTVFFLHPTSII